MSGPALFLAESYSDVRVISLSPGRVRGFFFGIRRTKKVLVGRRRKLVRSLWRDARPRGGSPYPDRRRLRKVIADPVLKEDEKKARSLRSWFERMTSASRSPNPSVVVADAAVSAQVIRWWRLHPRMWSMFDTHISCRSRLAPSNHDRSTHEWLSHLKDQ